MRIVNVELVLSDKQYQSLRQEIRKQKDVADKIKLYLLTQFVKYPWKMHERDWKFDNEKIVRR